MALQNYILSIGASAGVLYYILYLLRKQRLKERHAIWWLTLGSLALAFSVFPELLTWLSQMAGFGVPSNMVFFISIAVLFLVSIQSSSELTSLEEKNRVLAEKIAVIELQLRDGQ